MRFLGRKGFGFGRLAVVPAVAASVFVGTEIMLSADWGDYPGDNQVRKLLTASERMEVSDRNQIVAVNQRDLGLANLRELEELLTGIRENNMRPLLGYRDVHRISSMEALAFRRGRKRCLVSWLTFGLDVLCL